MAENITAPKRNITLTTRYGAVAVPFIVVGGALIAFTYLNSHWRRKKEKHRVLKRSVSLAAIHGGKLALQRLIDYHEARADANKLDTATNELTDLFKKERLDILQLQRVVAKMEMSGNEAKAEQTLREEEKKARKKGLVHEAYEIEMLIVEMLIYKGDFKNAGKCPCLSDENISDVRRPLYKAIILAASDGAKFEKDGDQYWQDFNEMREHFKDPPSLKECLQEFSEGNEVRKLATNYDEFKRILLRFKDDIINAQAKKRRILKI